MVDVEQNVTWTSVDLDDRNFVNLVDVDYARQKDSSGEYEQLPTIVVESNQPAGSDGAGDAPIVIYPNDPSVVGAEEIVMEENVADIDWNLGSDAVEEVVVGTSSRLGNDHGNNLMEVDTSEIPLQDETYATFHPFPCDFCCRRFKKKANLMNHMVAHQTQRPHSCHVCSSRFMRKCDLVNHQKIHSYTPNRDNLVEIGSPAKKGRSPRGRPRASGSVRPETPERPHTDDLGSSSPERFDDRSFKNTNYVDEDVKLLLEMTTKLHESRKSEGSDSTTTIGSPPEPTKPAGTADKPYVCSKCNRCFARESALISHSQVHAEDSTHDCEKCGSRFFTMDLLKEHYMKKHQTTYNGDSSDEQEAEGEQRKDRRNSYTGDERFGNFNCNVCPLSFHRMELLKQHKRNSHVDDSGLQRCKSCHTTFSSQQRLIDHLYTNEDCQEHVCLLCGVYFNDQPSVQAHVKSRHGREIGPTSCVYCGRDCITGHSLKQHIVVHFTERRYRCKRTECNKKFSSWGKLRRHMQSHTEDRSVACDDCDEDFPDRRALLNHRHSHNRNQKRFVCQECGKSFGSRSSQQIHNRIHTGERPYGCRFCWKAFADGGTLRKHERIHTGEKPYVCAVCPRAFNQRVVLREHIRSHHSGSVNKIGFSSPVYHCQVCGIYATSSEELGSHLVQHSDDNTVKNRVPQVGVRPYKRRKKTPIDLDELDEFDDSHFFHNSETESVDSEKQPPSTSTSKRTTPRRRRENNSSYAKLSRSMDAAMKNINSIVEAPVRKAKMINTKLQPNTGKPGRGRGAKRKGRTVEVSHVVTSVTKVRTSGRLSSRRISIQEEEEDDEETDEVEDATQLQDDEEPPPMLPLRLGRPRTKNVSYETLQSLNKGMEPATFPANPALKMVDEIKYEKEEVKEEIEEEDDGIDHRVCGICNQVFTSKADLLFHVPVHI